MFASGRAGRVIAFSVLALFFAGSLRSRATLPQESDASAAPGPLSAFHADKPGAKNCSSCHAPGGEAEPAKCLACHEEIASRIKAGRGFHRDKTEGCGTCHAEHQGADAKLVPLDPGDFDHGETGFVLEGAHARVGECAACHYGKAAFQRTHGRSYLLRDGRCSACHVSPHPGRQDECLDCHSMDGWRADRGPVVKW